MRTSVEQPEPAEVVTVMHLSADRFRIGHAETTPDEQDEDAGFYAVHGPAPPPGELVRARARPEHATRTVAGVRWKIVCAATRWFAEMP